MTHIKGKMSNLMINWFIFIVMLFLPLGNRSISQTSTPYVIINGFIFIDQITTCHLSAYRILFSRLWGYHCILTKDFFFTSFKG
jgi:hypothetical protein